MVGNLLGNLKYLYNSDLFKEKKTIKRISILQRFYYKFESGFLLVEVLSKLELVVEQ